MAVESAPATRSGLVLGRRSTARVPATSANLGPGFDSMGLALSLHDVVTLSLMPAGLEIEVEGEGAGKVPLTEDHLVVRAIRAGFDHAGVPQPGIRLHCANVVPHGRGLGSSAAATVAGLIAARGCLADPQALDDTTVLALATSLEGHPDNAAAALLGGCTISWNSPSGVPRAERIEVRADLEPVACVPTVELSTSKARAMLPALVPHPDASFNAGRAALLVHALTRRPDLLPEATEDRLHQTQRAPAMPETAALIHRIREQGVAAMVSGAGPTVLALGYRGEPAAAVRTALEGPQAARWTVLELGVDTVGTMLATEGE